MLAYHEAGEGFLERNVTRVASHECTDSQLSKEKNESSIPRNPQYLGTINCKGHIRDMKVRDVLQTRSTIKSKILPQELSVAEDHVTWPASASHTIWIV
jgi:hypothetical protein